ncbi:MAG: hypothetical protein WBC85_09125 [Planktotalea sp.]|uniref:hypothetical protein n=1 Tax=Planktotalea sp. TaxID=2029877 RepID=UPI003C71F45D
MSALRKTSPAFTTPTTDIHSGQGAELFTAGAAPSVDGTHTHMFSSGSAPSVETAQFSGALTELFSSGS